MSCRVFDLGVPKHPPSYKCDRETADDEECGRTRFTSVLKLSEIRPQCEIIKKCSNCTNKAESSGSCSEGGHVHSVCCKTYVRTHNSTENNTSETTNSALCNDGTLVVILYCSSGFYDLSNGA